MTVKKLLTDKATLRYVRSCLEDACICLDNVEHLSTSLDDAREYTEMAREAVERILVENVGDKAV